MRWRVARNRLARAGLAVAVSAVASWPVQALAQGCAMCRTALDGQDDPLVGAFNTSVLFLMVMPYAVVAFVGGWIYLEVRRQAALRMEREAAAALAPGPTEG